MLRNSEPHSRERDIACVAVDEEGANKEQLMAAPFLQNFHSHMEFAMRVEHSTSLMHLQGV